MKKILLAFAVATIFAACGDSKTKTDSTTTDSTGLKVDTTTKMNTVTDTSRVDSASHMGTDTSSMHK